MATYTPFLTRNSKRYKAIEPYICSATLLSPVAAYVSMFSGECSYYHSVQLSSVHFGQRLRTRAAVGNILPTQAPTPTLAETVDSDRLQLRLRLRLRSPCRWY